MEEWRFIEGYNEQYSISSHGRVRSNYRNSYEPMTKTRGRKYRILEMKLRYDKDGYLTVMLSDRTPKKVHRLVASTFIENPLGLATVNHKDARKDNNHVLNLEWMTAEDNLAESHIRSPRTFGL